QALVGVALDVELALRAPRTHQLGQRRDVAPADMALVGARVDREAVGAGIVGDPGEVEDVGNAGAPRVAQQRDLVEIYRKAGHAGEYILGSNPPPRGAQVECAP